MAVLLAPSVVGAPAATSHPAVPRPTPETVRAPLAMGPIHPGAAPPPFDWDPMWFNASTSHGVNGAGGAGAQLAVDDLKKIAIMFGGYTPSAGVTNATWLVNQTTAVWYLLPTPVAPSPRLDFSMASAPRCGVAVLFGGLIDPLTGEVTNDTWLFNFSTRTWQNITQRVGPAPRQGAALTVDDTTCQAVLFGGADIDYRSGNSTGNVRWNDTWVLDLSNHTWHPIPTVNTPPSLTDAGFLYDNVSNIFLLYGGCDSLCSPTVWQFDPVNSTWIARSIPSSDPVGRGGMGWVYSDTYDIAVLSMGYTLEGNQRIPLNDTYVYEIGQNRFDAVGPPTPTPRFDVANGWLGANGCPGFLLVGGAGAPTDPPDQWFLDPAPDVPLACNTWGNDSISNAGGGYNCLNEFNLTVHVMAQNGTWIKGANVTQASNCSQSSRYTGPTGVAYFQLTYQAVLITVTAKGFHPNSTIFQASNTSVAGSLSFWLTPLPTLVVHSYEQPLSGPELPLGNVTISNVEGVVLGVTDLNGSLLIPSFEPTGSFYTFIGNCSGYSTGTTTSPVPYTGNWTVNITLLAPGPIDVQVLEQGTNTSLPGALVTVRTVSTEAPAGFQTLSNPDGWANATTVAGNYTATATLAGYTQFSLPTVFFHPWHATTVVRITMVSSAGYTVEVRVLDRTTHQPIPTATVQVGIYPPRPVIDSGWMNQSGIKPAGTYGVLAAAPNYSSNRTSVLLSYYHPIWVFTLNLTPLVACSSTNPGPNCTKAQHTGTTYQPLTLW
ncbi:MAG TPA: kelch repeat-containing protein, partial [Thermoplasmata archaeon]|nr:kelch repeat-containing protein [Thermoplasmata archaeon]